MAGDIPDGLAIEQVWAVESSYAPDAAERRKAVRAEHLTRIGELREAGTIIEAGGFADMSGSLILIRAATEDEALAIVRADIYFRSGVWTGFRIRALGRVTRSGELPRSRRFRGWDDLARGTLSSPSSPDSPRRGCR